MESTNRKNYSDHESSSVYRYSTFNLQVNTKLCLQRCEKHCKVISRIVTPAKVLFLEPTLVQESGINKPRWNNNNNNNS